MGEGKWCYSFNEENFEGDYETREEAIKEAEFYLNEEEEDIDYFYIGTTKSVSTGIDVNWLLEQLNENACEQAGEYAEDFLYNVTKEHEDILEDRLNSVFQSWMKEFDYTPKFYTVENVEKVKKSNLK